MNALESTRPVARLVADREPTSRRSLAPSGYELIGPARQAILCARQLLLSEQQAGGRWQAVVHGDATVTSQALITLACVRSDDDLEPLVEAILQTARPQGGWSRIPGGPLDVSASVQAYLALRIAGCDPTERPLSRAREAIVAAGGADRCDFDSRLLLAITGQISYDDVVPLPPELLLLPHFARQWFGLDCCSWLSRNLPALSIVWSHRVVKAVSAGCLVRELFVDHPHEWPTAPGVNESSRLRQFAQQLIHWLERRGWLPMRERALARAEQELLHRVNHRRDGVCRVQDLAWTMLALDALGYSKKSPELVGCFERLHELIHVDPQSEIATCQPYVASRVDTADAVSAIVTSGLPASEPALYKAVDVILRCVISEEDASVTTSELAAILRGLRSFRDGGPVNNEALPPVIGVHVADDRLLPSESAVGGIPSERIDAAAASVVRRLCARQLPNGGWAAFAGDGARSISSPDATGAAIVSLAAWRTEDVDSPIARGVEYLQRTQRANGSWDSRAGVRFIHGTSGAVRGLLAAGQSADELHVAAGLNWLVLQQRPGGGWLESPGPLDTRFESVGSPTQTAWALRALLDAGLVDTSTVKRGIHFLLETQEAFGGWSESQFVLGDDSGKTWFANELMAITEPLTALSQWAVAFAEIGGEAPVKLRVVGVA